MKTAIYLRKSRQDEEIKGATIEETLARHELRLREYAKNNNINIIKTYKEVASASDIDGRPVFNELLREVEQGTYNAVLCVALDRLTRGNAVDAERVKNTFKFTKSLIITPNKVYNPANDDDEFFIDFSLFMASRELSLIRARMLQGKKIAQQQGYYIGSVAPYGYDKQKNKNAKGQILVPNENEAPIVKYIFEQYANNTRMVDIMDYLNNNGILTKKGYKWTHVALKRVLKNKTYIGLLAVDRRKTVSTMENGVHIKKLKPNPDVEYIEGKHEPIISAELWERAQYRIKECATAPIQKNATQKNPLAGLVKCSYCGATMKRHFTKTYPVEYLVCPTVKCECSAAELRFVEQRIIDELSEALKGYKIYLENYEEEYEVKKANKQAELKVLNDNLSKRRKMLSKAFEMVETGIYSPDEFKARKNEITADIEHIQQTIKDVESRNDNADVEIVRKYIPNLEKCLAYYWTLDAQKKNILLKSLIDNIVYSRKGRALRNGDKKNFNLVITLKI